MISRQQWSFVGCCSHDKGKAVKDICSVGCIACALCAKVTKSGAITMENSLPRLNINIGQDFEEAVQRCPMHCFVVRAVSGKAPEVTPQTSSAVKSGIGAKA